MKTTPGGTSLLYAVHEHVDQRPGGTRRLMMLTLDYLTTNQSKDCPRVDHALLREHWLLTTPSREGHSFEGINLPWSPLPGKVINLFLSITSPKILSLRFNPAPMHRGWISAVIWLHSGDWPSAQSHERKIIWELHSLRSCHSSFSSSPQSTFFCLYN